MDTLLCMFFWGAHNILRENRYLCETISQILIYKTNLLIRIGKSIIIFNTGKSNISFFTQKRWRHFYNDCNK